MANVDTNTSLNLSLIENGWFFEKNDGWKGRCLGYSVNKILVLKKTKYQEILIFDSEDCRVMVLDGIIQFDSLWEHIYHEMLTHVPLFAHPNPENVLVIGGGDGGVIREVIKHKLIKNIVWVEIDKDVVELSKEYFPSIYTQNVCNDKRINLMIDDGIKYVQNALNESFDIIIVDGTDPIGTSPSNVLFTKEFFQNCHRILRKGGIMCSQNDSVCFGNEIQGLLLKKSIKNSRNIFINGDVKYCSIHTPMYIDGQISCLVSRKYSSDMDKKYNTIAVDKIYRDIPNEIQRTLKYYTKKIHQASFVMPRKVEIALSKL